jgi:AcrR family transcriptional regulator
MRKHSTDEMSNAQRVLRAAKAVFIRDGATAFSARRVAKEVGLSLRAVQHYYPTTELLLAAVVDLVVYEFESAFEDLYKRLPFNPEARLLGVVEILLSANWHQDTRRVFYGLYALSCYKPFAAKLMDRMYARHTHQLATLIGAARSSHSEKRCKEIAVIIASLLDGTMIFTGPGNDRLIAKSALAQAVRSSVLALLDAPPVRTPEARRGTSRALSQRHATD